MQVVIDTFKKSTLFLLSVPPFPCILLISFIISFFLHLMFYKVRGRELLLAVLYFFWPLLPKIMLKVEMMGEIIV